MAKVLDEYTQACLAGAEIVHAAKTTMGPKGWNVVIGKVMARQRYARWCHSSKVLDLPEGDDETLL